MNKNLLYLFLFVLAACSKAEKKSPNVFFAGEIVNPTNDYVVLFKGDVVIDSAKLDENNRFAFKLDTLSDGLYHFNHAPEYQYVYLEKGDSLMIRLNTAGGSFDESLVFSGNGEEINNFLLDLFLVNEDEEGLIYSKYFGMEPDDFRKRIDSLRLEKLAQLKALGSDVKISKQAQEIAKASINYNYYDYMERYPFEHKKRLRDKEIHELPNNFYAFRKGVDFNNSNFTYLRPYYDFMKSHFDNLTYMDCVNDCSEGKEIVKNELHYNRHKLKLIDSLVLDKELKDNLLRNVAFKYLLKVHDKEENNKTFIDEFHKLSGNNKHIKEIDALYEAIRNIQPNKEIPNFYVSNVAGDSVSLQNIAKKDKTVFYFWSGSDKNHLEKMAKRVAQLSAAKPEYSFVGINIMTDEATWRALLANKGLDANKQFRAENFEELTKKLIVYPLNKCIITDDAKIVDAFSNMYASF
jgi:hypothetical protein